MQTGNTVRGHLAEDTVVLANLAQFASVTDGSFVVDGKAISINVATDTVQSLIGKINASGARVVASYDADSDKIHLESSDANEDEIPIGSDSSGFLAAARLSAADTVRGNIRDDGQVLAKTTQFGAVTNGSFDVNGKTIAVDVAADSLLTIIDKINSAGVGVTASLNESSHRIELVSDAGSEDLIEVGNDTSGFLDATRLAAANTVRGNVPDDQQVFAKTTQFAGVGNGTFRLNGVSISVNAGADSLQSMIGKINGANAGVTASYDEVEGKLVLSPDADTPGLVLEDDSSGFLAAARIGTGAFGTRVNPDAAFNGAGFGAPFLDPGLQVQAGSFTVNGVEIGVAANDTVNSVLSRITASAANVTAVYDDATQTLKLTSRQGSSAPIVTGDDTSGFLAAVKLDATAESVTGLAVVSSFDAELSKMPEYGDVHAGVITVNGQSITIDPASTSIRGLVSALNGISGVLASLDESSGKIKVSATRQSDALTLADTSGLLAALGIRTGTYRGRPGSSKIVETVIGSQTVSNAGEVASGVAQAAIRVNDSLAALGHLEGTPQFRDQVESLLQTTIGSLVEGGATGLRLDSRSGDLRLLVDREGLAVAVGGMASKRRSFGVEAAAVLDKLGGQVAALGGRVAAQAAPQGSGSDPARDQPRALFKSGPVSTEWVLDLLQTVSPGRSVDTQTFVKMIQAYKDADDSLQSEESRQSYLAMAPQSASFTPGFGGKAVAAPGADSGDAGGSGFFSWVRRWLG